MSGPSDVPAVVVERAPDGWTHIGGPGMHLLIGLDEEDERTLTASDAADGGDLDDVIEVLTAGGMRKAHHFVGVHWQPRTRVVAFGPVSALVTLPNGSEHDVRATSSRVWTDLELPEHPERVVLRVLDESERSQPAQTLVPGLSAPGGAEPTDARTPTVAAPAAPAVVALAVDAPPVVAPAAVAQPSTDAPTEPVGATGTPAAPAAAESRKHRPWDRSWATPSPGPASSAPSHPPAVPPAPAPTPPALRPWSSVRPPVPSRSHDPASAARAAEASAPAAPAPAPATLSAPAAAEAPAQEVPATVPPAADDLPPLPPTPPHDVDSTWAARPVLEPETAPASATTPSPPAHRAAAPTPLAGEDTDVDDQPAVPSYDYLFGHTTAADEHRRVLAELTRSDEDEEAGDDEVLSVPAVADSSEAAVTNVAPPAEVPPAPIPTVPDLPAVPEGGLISSVPWASSAPVPDVPKPEPEVPTFSGRHTPPPPPSLLPPLNTPPLNTPPAAPSAPAAPTVGAAYPVVPRPQTEPQTEPQAEPSFDVSIARPQPVAPAPPAPPAPSAEFEDDDDAELTVDRSALLEARHAAQSQAVSGPSVLAVLCSAGHPTPPHSDRCRVCGAGIPPQGPFTMSRPPLGILRLSTGDVVTLDRSVLLGRAPKLGDGLAVHDRPHVVKVPSPERDISRNHVEVILEGWHVLIRDLGTTNGTTVALPGESPVRLRANDQQVLEPGSLVSMADEVSFTFETAI